MKLLITILIIAVIGANAIPKHLTIIGEIGDSEVIGTETIYKFSDPEGKAEKTIVFPQVINFRQTKFYYEERRFDLFSIFYH